MVVVLGIRHHATRNHIEIFFNDVNIVAFVGNKFIYFYDDNAKILIKIPHVPRDVRKKVFPHIKEIIKILQEVKE